ncbi:MAG: hypothetical protein ACK6D7_07860, partial [Acidobacteriota bacterium]
MSFLFALLLFAAPEWPQFRGPGSTGVAADDPRLPITWSPTQNITWATPIPGEDQRSGQTLWRQPAPRPRQEPLDKRNSPASPSPVSDGERVYVFFPDYGLLAYSLDGKRQWSVPLGPFD